MAKGIHNVSVVIDTATNPDDTELLAAPGAGQTIYIRSLDVVVTTAVASTFVGIEDGVGGDRLMHVSSATAGTTRFDYSGDGRRLTDNTALNATSEGTAGAVVTVLAELEVR